MSDDSSSDLTSMISPELPGNIRVAVLRDGRIEKFPENDRKPGKAGSVTKLFTAALLIDETLRAGLSLDTPVTTVLNWLPSPFQKVTLRHLLSHQAGLRDWLPTDPPEPFDETAFFTEPGQIFSYSNPGFALLGGVIEKLTGHPFRDELHRRVILPSRMRDTGFLDEEGPAGGLVATTADLARGARWLIERSDLLVEMMTLGVGVPSRSGQRAGAGCFLFERDGILFFEHQGMVDGTVSLLRVAPQLNFAVAVLTTEETAPESVADVILENDLGMIPVTPPSFRFRRVDPGEFDRFTGSYANLPRRTRIFTTGDQIFLQRGGTALPLVWNGDDRLAIPLPLERRSPDVPIIFQKETSRAEYLYPFGSLRAVRRLEGMVAGKN
jgi:hypothetical protein